MSSIEVKFPAAINNLPLDLEHLAQRDWPEPCLNT